MADVTQDLNVHDTAVPWRDGKRYLWIFGAVIPSIPFMWWGLVAATGQGIWWYFGPVFVFVLIPLVDLFAGFDRNNPPDEVIEWLEEDKYYRWITYAFIPIQYAALITAAYLFGGGSLPGVETLGAVDKIGLALGVGMVAGVGINTAHELGHKKEKHERWFARIDVLNAWAFSIVLWGGLLIAFGPEILPYMIIQAVAGIWLLESVNYLKHYGMLRATLELGRYERVNPSHSWNSNNIGTNVLLYHLQRHSDYHANPTRRYQALRNYKESPTLPTGYAGMIVLSWIPQLWWKVMDPRVLDHFDGDMCQANIAPRKRDKILAPTAAHRDAYECPTCGYVYDEKRGDPREGWPAGTLFDQIDSEWCCPDCGVREQQDFIVKETT